MRVRVYIVHIYIEFTYIYILHVVQDAVRGLMAMYDDSEADF